MQKQTHTVILNQNYFKAMQMLEHGVATGVLKEKDGKIMVFHGVRPKYVDKKTMAKQVANNAKMMRWLENLTKFTDKMTKTVEEDEKNGTVTMVSIKDIPNLTGDEHEDDSE